MAGHWRENGVWGLFTGFWGILTVLVSSALILLAAPFMGPHRAFRFFTWCFVRQLCWICGVKLTVEGVDALPDDLKTGRSPAVYMSNHASNLDPPLFVSALPAHAVFLSKSIVRWVPLIGWATWAGGAIFIERTRRESALRGMRKAARALQNGDAIALFPEGTRTKTGQLGSFKKGGFTLAMDAGVPIVPVAIQGIFAIYPPGTKRLRPGRVTIRFGAPIESAGMTRDALMATVRDHVEALLRDGL